MRAILADKLYIPESLLPPQALERWSYYWTQRCYEEESDIHGNVILDSRGKPKTRWWDEEREIKTYRNIRTNGSDQWVSLLRGDLGKVKELLTGVPVVDIRSQPPLGFDLEMSETTISDHRWPDQTRCVSEWIDKGYGIIKGETGSGKTLVAIGTLTRLGLKTLILTDLKGGKAQWESEVRKHTNIEDVERDLNTKLVGEIKAGKNPFPISIATVQTFVSTKGRDYLVSLQDEFGLIIVDECHAFATPEYSRIVTTFNAHSLLGATATEERTDRGHLLMFDMFGPVVTEGRAKQMPPTVTFVSTGVNQPRWLERKAYNPRFKWRKILEHIETSDQRYDVIMTFLQKDLDDGRITVVLSQRTKIIKELFQRLKQDGYRVGYVDGKTRKREEIYQAVKEGKIQCLCAGKVLNKQVDLPNVNCLHFVSPVASESATKQAYGRARRWMEGKELPLIRDYVDSGGQLSGAYRKRKGLCEKSGWKIKIIDSDEVSLERMSPWLRRQT